jgi:flagellar FliJ protein
VTRAFRFELEGVLSYRRMIEEEAHREFLLAQQRLDLAGEALARLFLYRTEAQGDLAGREGGSFDVAEVLRYHDYLKGLVERIAEAQVELAGLERERNARRSVLSQASRDRKVIEKVRDRRRQAWRSDVERDEQKETDEVGAQLHRRVGGGVR